MTQGKLLMVVCPILEDELIYNLSTDKEEKNVFLLANDHTTMIKPKLAKNNIPYTEIPENDYLSGKEKIPDDGFNVIIWMMNLGLHEEPKDLKAEVYADLKKIDGRIDGIMMYYGLCGQAFNDILDWSKENMKTPVTIFKDKSGKICDDCICVPIGGTDRYYELLKKYPGVMYLTPAFACSQDELLLKMEMFKGLENDGKANYEMLKMILDMAGYTTTMKIDTHIGDQEHFQSECERYAKNLGLKLTELEEGWTSTQIADDTYAEAKSFLR